MKITLRGVVRVLRTVLGMVPESAGGGGAPIPRFEVGATSCNLFVAENPYRAHQMGGLMPVDAFALDLNAEIVRALLKDAKFADLASRIHLSNVIDDPSNVVLLLVSGQSADHVRLAAGLGGMDDAA